MNAGATSERVYDALKAQILSRAFRPGDRLDPAVLSEPLNASVTPVRDALNTMKGEGLVEARASEGFYLPQVDAPALRDLYRWNEEILRLAIRAWPSSAAYDSSAPAPALADKPPPDATAVLFGAIGRRSPNFEHRRAIASANDRLQAVRWAEAKVLAKTLEELKDIERSIGNDAPADLRRLLSLYHRRRLRAADEIVRTLYRNGD